MRVFGVKRSGSAYTRCCKHIHTAVYLLYEAVALPFYITYTVSWAAKSYFPTLIVVLGFVAHHYIAFFLYASSSVLRWKKYGVNTTTVSRSGSIPSLAGLPGVCCKTGDVLDMQQTVDLCAGKSVIYGAVGLPYSRYRWDEPRKLFQLDVYTISQANGGCYYDGAGDSVA